MQIVVDSGFVGPCLVYLDSDLSVAVSCLPGSVTSVNVREVFYAGDEYREVLWYEGALLVPPAPAEAVLVHSVTVAAGIQWGVWVLLGFYVFFSAIRKIFS